MTRIKKNGLLLLCNVFAVIFYFSIIHALGGMEYVRQTVFSTGDSKEYLGYSEWISGASEYCDPFRTFMYPLLILLPYKLCGVPGIWMMQFIFWIVSCNLVFISAARVCGNVRWGAAAFLLLASSISLISLTAHALTEITVLFFLSVFVSILARHHTDLRSPAVTLRVIFLLAVLAVVKPVFSIPFFLSCLLFLLIHFKHILRRPVLFLLLPVCSLPYLAQVAINKTKHDTFSTSQIADYNLRNYFFLKTEYRNAHGSLDGFDTQADSIRVQQMDSVKAISKAGIISFLLRHPVQSFAVFWDDERDNLGSGHPYIKREQHESLYKWTENINDKYFYVHILFFVLWLYLIFSKRGRKSASHLFLLASGLLLYYLFATLGITFWAGDRLGAPVCALWAVVYVGILKELLVTRREHSTRRVIRT
ncbi:MAG TPA: hypothetical protein VI112_13535 [Bacteroidia bacterium]|jgi:hypothetical protein